MKFKNIHIAVFPWEIMAADLYVYTHTHTLTRTRLPVNNLCFIITFEPLSGIDSPALLQSYSKSNRWFDDCFSWTVSVSVVSILLDLRRPKLKVTVLPLMLVCVPAGCISWSMEALQKSKGTWRACPRRRRPSNTSSGQRRTLTLWQLCAPVYND